MRPARRVASETFMVGSAISTGPKRPIDRRWKNTKPYAVRTPRDTSAWNWRGCTTTWAASTAANRIRRNPQNEHRQALALLAEKTSPPAGARHAIRVGEDVLSLRTRSGPVGEPRAARRRPIRSRELGDVPVIDRRRTPIRRRHSMAALPMTESRWAGTPRRVPAIPKT